MKTVVIYKSKTGFTKKYAEWIAEELSADIFNASKVNVNTLNKYDTIIYGGSLYAVGIIGVGLIKKNINKLKDKRLVVFATGASPLRDNVINEVINKNFTVDEQKYIKFFYLRGGFNYNKLSSFDKFLMTLLKWKIKNKKKEDLSADEKGMLAIYDKPVDFTDKKNIWKIITCVNS
ncbi:menaquinone-dependent protoporphyrinogen IX oxidase [Clostridium beijerinckii]|uniref:flavodoxin domain-containing protein n=1 Tax=Clostridium beijerinckii TaxID=1520 RepID=UPI00156DC290|nr:flavodoxin domain-containing protein [Clostridium beijerinckii]NRT36084.1 menaquinone-dependent protoporphyrinogen IX oxidase [Clostridium beijerinckii]NRT44489.1 menaquinone-dependent protoporphyrinogen IX oxidase [Clostridium beijerinckii]NRZ21519.1 menaquinone-dependent protoporphyrinogen IX oxidase [Clostridium beijerinckii]